MPEWSPPALPQIFHAWHGVSVQTPNIYFFAKYLSDMGISVQSAVLTFQPDADLPDVFLPCVRSVPHFALSDFPLPVKQALLLPQPAPDIFLHRKALPEAPSQDTLWHFPLSDTESLWRRWNVHTRQPAAWKIPVFPGHPLMFRSELIFLLHALRQHRVLAAPHRDFPDRSALQSLFLQWSVIWFSFYRPCNPNQCQVPGEAPFYFGCPAY